MGTSSGGGPFRAGHLRLFGETRKLESLFRNILIGAFMTIILCSMVICKQTAVRSYDTKRLSHHLRHIYDDIENGDDIVHRYNDNHKILRPKREISSGFKSMKSVNYCTWNAPLKTKYLTPYYEENREVRGCTSSEKTESGVVVHAISLDTSQKNVLLTVEDYDNTTTGIILLLHSSTPVNWRLSLIGEVASEYNQASLHLSRNVYLSPGSTLINHQTIPINVHIHNQMNEILGKGSIKNVDESIVETIRHKWGALTTFSRISDANRISISLPHDIKLPHRCLIEQNHSGIETQNLDHIASVAYMISKQNATGCFNEEVAGTSGSDVHVIDLQTAEEGGILDDNIPSDDHESIGTESDVNDSEGFEDEFLPNVYLSLAPEGSNNDDNVLRRNLTLILNSKQRVKWYLESIDLSGHLKVISTNGPVYDYDLSPDQQLSIENNPLPAAFDQLWKAVVRKTNNNPISYSRIEKANVLTIIVPDKSQREPWSSQVNPKDNTANMVPEPNEPSITGPIISNKKSNKNVEDHLKSFLSKICNQQRTVISLPLTVASHLNVIGVHLEEDKPECRGTRNKTHWILTTTSTSCGSVIYYSGQHPMMKNNVILKFAPGSQFANLEVRLPFECRFCPGFQEFESSDYNEEDCDDEDADIPKSPFEKEELYEMKVSLQLDGPKTENKVPHSRVLLEDRFSPAVDVKTGDTILVSTFFDTSKDFLNLAINKCWLSDHRSNDEQTIDERDWLLYDGCPSDRMMNGNANNVKLLPTLSQNGPSFSFDITNRIAHDMRYMYINCLMGFCSRMGAFGNIEQCADPSTSCFEAKNDTANGSDVKQGRHVALTAQQLILRGPLRIIPPILSTPHDSVKSSPSNEIPFDDDVFGHYKPSGGNKDDKKYGDVVPDENDDRPPTHHSSHAVMVGVPLEIAIAVALASFVIGAALTGILCCIHHKKSSPKMGAWRNGDVMDGSTEASELQHLASPELQSQQLFRTSQNHRQQQNHTSSKGRSIIT